MAFEYKFCPGCKDDLVKNEEGYLACPSGEFVHYNNPVPTVANLVPFTREDGGEYLGKYGLKLGAYTDTGILLVKRKNPPFPGKWCFPCGFVEQRARPKKQVIDETLQESGIHVEVQRILYSCNPLPDVLNHIVETWLSRPIGGVLQAGDDAIDVGIFDCENLPPMAFTSHFYTIEQWYAGKYGSL